MAKGICGGCAVREPCLEFALSRPELLGVWGATTPVERTTIRRARLEPPLPVPVPVTVQSVGEIVAGFDVQTPPEPQFIDLVRAERDDRDDRDVEARRRAAGHGPGRVEPVDRDELLTPAEAARKLGVTPNTVTRWSRAGKISAIQTMGGHRRFRLSEIERVLCDGSSVAAQACEA